jgi:hypothetical protein
MKEMARRDFLKLGAAGLAVASLGGSVTLGPLARKAGAAVVEATYFDAETMSFQSGVGVSVVNDTSANFGKVLCFQQRSTTAVKNGQNFRGEGSIVRIRARASQNSSGGWPVAAVLVDGREVARWTVNTTSLQMYSANVSPSVSAGAHNVSLQAVQGLIGPGTLYVDFVQFQRPDAPTQTPTENLVVHGIYARGISTGPANPQWGDLSQLTNYTNLVGKKPTLVHGFQQIQDSISVSGIDNVLANYPEFMLTLEAGGMNLAQMIAGQADAHFDRIGRDLGSINHTIYVRLMHEMNGNWYSYSAGRVSDGEAKYRDVFRRGVSRMTAAGGSNLRFVWCPNVRAPVWGGNPLRNFYPGDDVVDILGLDGYAGYRTQTPFTFNIVFDAAVDEICAIHASKPLWLCEWGMDAWDYSAAEKERFFEDARASLGTQRYSRVKASLYFHSTQEGYRWRVDDPLACLDNYQGLINDPVYQGASLL